MIILHTTGGRKAWIWRDVPANFDRTFEEILGDGLQFHAAQRPQPLLQQKRLTAKETPMPSILLLVLLRHRVSKTSKLFDETSYSVQYLRTLLGKATNHLERNGSAARGLMDQVCRQEAPTVIVQVCDIPQPQQTK